jgi:20S proteasome alpha/beta subunit
MTVCIAAICSHGGTPVIVGATDRLITYGDFMEYPRHDPKNYRLATHTVALTAGSPQDHNSIIARTLPRIPQAGPTVEQIATLYAEEFANLRRLEAERKYLTPRGLSAWTFLNRITNLSPDIAEDLSQKMEKEELGSSAIIAGIDERGPHLFLVQDPGVVVQYDYDGWLAIGSGAEHADLLFISEKYHPNCTLDEAFLLTYLAKKRADITPGVGVDTDLFWIAPDLQFQRLTPEHEMVKLVRDLHEAITKQQEELSNAAKGVIKEWVDNAIKEQQAAAAQQQVAEEISEGTSEAAQPKRIRKRSKKGKPEA